MNNLAAFCKALAFHAEALETVARQVRTAYPI